MIGFRSHWRGSYVQGADSRAPRFLEQDARTRTFYCACPRKTGERPIESLAREAQLARYVLKLTSQVDGAAIGSGVEIKIEHHPLFGGAYLHDFEPLPKIEYLMRHQFQEG